MNLHFQASNYSSVALISSTRGPRFKYWLGQWTSFEIWKLFFFIEPCVIEPCVINSTGKGYPWHKTFLTCIEKSLVFSDKNLIAGLSKLCKEIVCSNISTFFNRIWTFSIIWFTREILICFCHKELLESLGHWCHVHSYLR